jgi:hypothetical protein
VDLVTASQILGNVGEFVGAIAIVVTLAYLAVQVRHSKEATDANTQTIRANASKEVYLSWSDFNFELSRHPDRLLIDKIFKADTDYYQLDHEERAVVGFFFRSVVERFTSEHALFEAGILSSDAWGQLRRYCASFVSAPALADLWKVEQEQPIYPKQFLDDIRSISAAQPVIGATPHE